MGGTLITLAKLGSDDHLMAFARKGAPQNILGASIDVGAIEEGNPKSIARWRARTDS
jgi:hypothetical protein